MKVRFRCTVFLLCLLPFLSACPSGNGDDSPSDGAGHELDPWLAALDADGWTSVIDAGDFTGLAFAASGEDWVLLHGSREQGLSRSTLLVTETLDVTPASQPWISMVQRVQGAGIFAGGYDRFSGEGGFLILSTDEGDTWHEVIDFQTACGWPQEPMTLAFAPDGTVGYLGTSELRETDAEIELGCLVRTDDGGSSWGGLPAPPDLQGQSINVISATVATDDGQEVWIGTGNPCLSQGGLYHSSTGGQEWSLVRPDQQERYSVSGLIATDGVVLAGYCDNEALFRGPGGIAWEQVLHEAVSDMIERDGRLLGRTDEGLAWSDDLGLTWSQLEIETSGGMLQVLSLATHPSDPAAVFMGTSHGLFGRRVP